MANTSKIELKTSCILDVPLTNYTNDFTFIVNGQEFKTSFICSELLSPLICQHRKDDPTFDTFVINTQQRGNFSHILNLTQFQQEELSDEELPFFSEVINLLGTESIKFSENDLPTEISKDNVFSLLKTHIKSPKLFKEELNREIEFISSHFFEFCSSNKEDLKNLNINVLYEILSSPNLRLNDEDDLLELLNEFCREDRKFSILYETVYFANVSTMNMKEFLSIFSIEDLNVGVWNRLCSRLESEIKREEQSATKRYNTTCKSDESTKKFTFDNDNGLSGIINFLRKNSSNTIDNILNITASSVNNGPDERYLPQTAFLYDEKNKHFVSKDEPNSWLCIDFKERRVIPTHYTIGSACCSPNWHHPKSWVIEGSTDKKSWEKLDEQFNCPYLNGRNLSHTFNIQNSTSKSFQFIRIKSTGPDWANTNYLIIESFEIYGTLINFNRA